ncbi:Pre-mRNA-splicing factor cwf16 [Madurella mycetomatis]|uniref:Splicing factor YJU2 n=1 Tax=Madurella mycetomatis TaxID=100816 RepID=A0A175W5D6_9PEZI|nr:Pre-mRNA-splicing factor cwf16 [Madurella mycetomatis]
MSERKVLTKYYPPDFDPSLVGRSRKPKGAAQAGPKVQTVRLMAPFSLRCIACGEYMYRGRKFNARKETPPDERYLGIQLFRFYIRCTRCSAEIVFRTDPKNQDYVVERGAKRNTEPWKRGLADGETEETDEQRLDRLEREMMERDADADGARHLLGDERNAMAELEAKTADAKREMAVADALDEIRSRNARLERAQREGGGTLLDGLVGVGGGEEGVRVCEEAGDVGGGGRGPDEDGSGSGTAGDGADGVASASSSDSKPTTVVATGSNTVAPAAAPAPSFKRQVKKKKDHAALLGIKKKQPPV